MTPDWTLAHLADAAAERAPDAPAVIADDRTLTFAGLRALADSMAAALVARGIGPEARVGLVAASRADSIALLLACAHIGAVLVAVNDRLAPDEVRWIVDDAECAVVFAEPRFRAAIGDAPYVDVTAGPWWSDGAAPPSATPRDVCLQLYTSGTSGRPKGALLAHGNWRAILDAWTPLMELDAAPGRARFLQVTPFFHVGGILMILSCLREGATLYLLPAFDPARAVDLLEAEHITHTLMVPAMVEWTLREPGVQGRDFSALHLMVYGAAPMPLRTLERANDVFGCRWLQGYGLTETSGVTLALLPEDHIAALDGTAPRARLTSAGRPIASCEARVVDGALADTDLGEVVTRGPSVFSGYWRGRGAAESWTDGWFHTGDVGRVGAEGYVSIVDRKKDMVLVGGENVYPREVERVLLEHAALADVAVVGAPHDVWGEVVVAFVVPEDGADPIPERALVRWCRERLANFKCPTRVHTVEALPRNAAGKLLKRELRERFGRAEVDA